MRVVGWWSRRTGQVLVALDANTAQDIVNALAPVLAVAVSPPLAQLHDALVFALREERGQYASTVED